jgi:hypothetical protein
VPRITAGALAKVFRGLSSNVEHHLSGAGHREAQMMALAQARCHASCWSTDDPWRKHASAHAKLCLDKRTYAVARMQGGLLTGLAGEYFPKPTLHRESRYVHDHRYAEGERIVACISGLSDASLRRSTARRTLRAQSRRDR